MSTPLERLVTTKFALLAVVSAFCGLALMLLAHWAAVQASGAWLRSWPVNDIGLGLFTTGLFGVAFHRVGAHDAEEEHIPAHPRRHRRRDRERTSTIGGPAADDPGGDRRLLRRYGCWRARRRCRADRRR